MKVTTAEVEGSQVVLDIEIEPERVEKAMDRAYRRIASRVNVPGFRRGKAPRVLVERVIGRDTMMNEALEILLPEAYQEAVQETGIEPVDNPKLDVISAEPLSVRATVPVRPKVELGDYRAIRQSEEAVEITEEQVDRTLENLRQSRVQWVPVERPATQGDMLTLKLRGRADDKEFLDTNDLHVILDPERPLLAPGVVEQLVEMKAGEQKTIELTLPEDFSEKELAGRKATLEATVSEVKEKQVPELDDELARSLGEHTSLEELRAAVRERLEEQARSQARRNLEESVVAAVVDRAKAEPPPSWVEDQANTLRRRADSNLQREGLTFEQFLRFSNRTEESYKEEVRAAALKQIKEMLVLNAVADAEGVAVTEEELEQALQEATTDRESKVSTQERETLKGSLKNVLRERKAVARLVEIAEGKKPDEVPTHAPEATSPTATESQSEE